MQSAAESARDVKRAGFTLIEVMIALIIAGLLAGVIFQLMQGQASVVGVQSARQEVQQNARGTLEMISSELRSAPPGGILVAEAQRIDFRVPRVWGVTCSVMTAGSGSVWVLIPRGAFPADFPASPSTATDWGFAVPAPSSGGAWRLLPIAAAERAAPACDPSTNPGDLANYEAVRLGYNGLGSPRSLGTDVLIWQFVTYQIGTDGSTSRVWVKRNNGSGPPQVMAGPLADIEGLRFRYWRGNSEIAPPGSSTSGFPCLTAVQTAVTMESTRSTTGGRQILRDSVRVALRNIHEGPPC